MMWVAVVIGVLWLAAVSPAFRVLLAVLVVAAVAGVAWFIVEDNKSFTRSKAAAEQEERPAKKEDKKDVIPGADLEPIALEPDGPALSAEERAAVPPDVEMFHVEQLDVPDLNENRCLVWLRPRLPADQATPQP